MNDVATMTDAETYSLADGVRFVPVDRLGPAERAAISADDSDVILRRPNAREGPQLVDAGLAALLRRFTTPTRLADAIVLHSAAVGGAPDDMLEAAYPMLQTLVARGFLRSSRSGDIADRTLSPGDRVAGRFEVVSLIARLEDTDVFLARDDDAPDRPVALKVAKRMTRRLVTLFAREATILEYLADKDVPAPAFVAHGLDEDRDLLYLASAHHPGGHPEPAAARLRMQRQGHVLRRLALSIANAFDVVLSAGVLHGDVHPGNVLVAPDGSVTLVDFAQARTLQGPLARHAAERAAAGGYYEPELAAAYDNGTAPPPASDAAQQFTVAIMLYRLITGTMPVETPAFREEQLAAAANSILRPWPQGLSPDVDALGGPLRRALSRDPSVRFPSFTEFAAALTNARPLYMPVKVADLPIGRAALLAQFDNPDANPERFLRPTASVYFGASGIAYALLRQAELDGDARFAALASLWSSRAEVLSRGPYAYTDGGSDLIPERVGPVSLYHSKVGVACVSALVAAALDEGGTFREAAWRMLRAIQTDWHESDLTLGWGGVVLGLAHLYRTTEVDPAMRDAVAAALDFQTDRLRKALRASDRPEMRPAPDAPPRFLGLAHGPAGIVFALLSADLVRDRPADAEALAWLDALADCSVAIGAGRRWPRLAQGLDGPFMADSFGGWCNGSAGMAMVFSLAARLTGDDRLARFAEEAALDAYEDRMDYHDLCCGAAGTAYAQLSIYRLTGGAEWLGRARRSAERAFASSMRMQPAFALYKGMTGLHLLASELAQPENARMPLLELI